MEQTRTPCIKIFNLVDEFSKANATRNSKIPKSLSKSKIIEPQNSRLNSYLDNFVYMSLRVVLFSSTARTKRCRWESYSFTQLWGDPETSDLTELSVTPKSKKRITQPTTLQGADSNRQRTISIDSKSTSTPSKMNNSSLPSCRGKHVLPSNMFHHDRVGVKICHLWTTWDHFIICFRAAKEVLRYGYGSHPRRRWCQDQRRRLNRSYEFFWPISYMYLQRYISLTNQYV